MNIYELEKRATPGPLWIDDDGFIAAGTGDDYVTFADCDCNTHDIDERESNKGLIVHKYNNFDKVLEAFKHAVDIIADHKMEEELPGPREMYELIARFETVKEVGV